MLLVNGYATGYTKERVEERAAFAARAIEELRSQTGSTSVVVHGNSGVSCGFAALMASAEDFNLVLLRKDNDNSHGASIEGPYGHRLDKYLILDDFISSGATMNRIRDKINTLHAQGSSSSPRPECVGIVLYDRHNKLSFKFKYGPSVPVLSRVSPECPVPVLSMSR